VSRIWKWDLMVTMLRGKRDWGANKHKEALMRFREGLRE